MKTLLLLTLLAVYSLPAFAVDVDQIGKDLQAGGVTGWIHGAVADQGLFVFTYRNPENFFDYLEMSLVTTDPAISKQLATFQRQDQVMVKGSFLPNPSPQKHVLISSITMVKKYVNPYPEGEHRYEAKIPDDLQKPGRATFLVHAIGGDGKILVLEYKDAVVPMFVTNPALTKNLFRNDMVEIAYKLQAYPGHPSHLNVDESAADPVKLVQSIQALHGKPAVIDGALVLFPKSPEILFNVFAVQELLPAGLNRQYTLVNFDNNDTFKNLRAKLQAAWDKYPGQYDNGRNKLVSRKLRVRATGTFNEIDPNQANPQILLKSVDSIEIYEH